MSHFIINLLFLSENFCTKAASIELLKAVGIVNTRHLNQNFQKIFCIIEPFNNILQQINNKIKLQQTNSVSITNIKEENRDKIVAHLREKGQVSIFNLENSNFSDYYCLMSIPTANSAKLYFEKMINYGHNLNEVEENKNFFENIDPLLKNQVVILRNMHQMFSILEEGSENIEKKVNQINHQIASILLLTKTYQRFLQLKKELEENNFQEILSKKLLCLEKKSNTLLQKSESANSIFLYHHPVKDTNSTNVWNTTNKKVLLNLHISAICSNNQMLKYSNERTKEKPIRPRMKSTKSSVMADKLYSCQFLNHQPKRLSDTFFNHNITMPFSLINCGFIKHNNNKIQQYSEVPVDNKFISCSSNHLCDLKQKINKEELKKYDAIKIIIENVNKNKLKLNNKINKNVNNLVKIEKALQQLSSEATFNNIKSCLTHFFMKEKLKYLKDRILIDCKGVFHNKKYLRLFEKAVLNQIINAEPTASNTGIKEITCLPEFSKAMSKKSLHNLFINHNTMYFNRSKTSGDSIINANSNISFHKLIAHSSILPTSMSENNLTQMQVIRPKRFMSTEVHDTKSKTSKFKNNELFMDNNATYNNDLLTTSNINSDEVESNGCRHNLDHLPVKLEQTIKTEENFILVKEIQDVYPVRIHHNNLEFDPIQELLDWKNCKKKKHNEGYKINMLRNSDLLRMELDKILNEKLDKQLFSKLQSESGNNKTVKETNQLVCLPTIIKSPLNLNSEFANDCAIKEENFNTDTSEGNCNIIIKLEDAAIKIEKPQQIELLIKNNDIVKEHENQTEKNMSHTRVQTFKSSNDKNKNITNYQNDSVNIRDLHSEEKCNLTKSEEPQQIKLLIKNNDIVKAHENLTENMSHTKVQTFKSSNDKNKKITNYQNDSVNIRDLHSVVISTIKPEQATNLVDQTVDVGSKTCETSEEILNSNQLSEENTEKEEILEGKNKKPKEILNEIDLSNNKNVTKEEILDENHKMSKEVFDDTTASAENIKRDEMENEQILLPKEILKLTSDENNVNKDTLKEKIKLPKEILNDTQLSSDDKNWKKEKIVDEKSEIPKDIFNSTHPNSEDKTIKITEELDVNIDIKKDKLVGDQNSLKINENLKAIRPFEIGENLSTIISRIENQNDKLNEILLEKNIDSQYEKNLKREKRPKNDKLNNKISAIKIIERLKETRRTILRKPHQWAFRSHGSMKATNIKPSVTKNNKDIFKSYDDTNILTNAIFEKQVKLSTNTKTYNDLKTVGTQCHSIKNKDLNKKQTINSKENCKTSSTNKKHNIELTDKKDKIQTHAFRGTKKPKPIADTVIEEKLLEKIDEQTTKNASNEIILINWEEDDVSNLQIHLNNFKMKSKSEELNDRNVTESEINKFQERLETTDELKEFSSKTSKDSPNIKMGKKRTSTNHQHKVAKTVNTNQTFFDCGRKYPTEKNIKNQIPTNIKTAEVLTKLPKVSLWNSYYKPELPLKKSEKPTKAVDNSPKLYRYETKELMVGNKVTKITYLVED